MMRPAEEFADGKFKIECGDIILQKAGDDAAALRGPGEIWQDEEGALQFKVFVGEANYRVLQEYMSRPREIGEIIPDADYFRLEAKDYSGPVWTADRVLAYCRGGFSDGLACGDLRELVQTHQNPGAAGFDSICLRFRGKLDFPRNKLIDTAIRVGGRDHRKSTALAAARIEDDDIKLTVLHEGDHTAVVLGLPTGGYTAATPSRLQESLQFVLGQQTSLMVIETLAGSQTVMRLRSPDRGNGQIWPPLRFYSFDEGGQIWRMFTTYFRHVYQSADAGLHPISAQIAAVIESSVASLDARVLALAVAVEGLAADCFSALAPASAEFLQELDSVAAQIDALGLSGHTQARILGALDAMRRPRNSDIIRAFIRKYELPIGLYESWSRLRQPAAHGAAIADRDVPTVIKLKDEVLSLLYSLVFAAIDYVGPRTDYSLPRWPTRMWPGLQSDRNTGGARHTIR